MPRFPRQPELKPNQELLARFLLSLQSRSAILTVKAYRNDVGNYLLHCEHQGREPISVDSVFIEEYLAGLTGYQMVKPGSKTQPAMPRTRNRVRSALIAFYGFLTRRKVISVNPVLEVSGFRVPRKLVSTLTEKQIEEVRAGCSPDFLPALEFLISSGVRASELLNLNWSQIDLEKRTAKVKGKGQTERVVRFSKRTADLLASLPRVGEAVFNVTTHSGEQKRMTYGQMRRRILSMNVLVDERLLWAHLFRHTMASHLVDSGVPIPQVRDLLGHANVSTTSIYLHSTAEQVERIEKAMDEI